MSWEPANSSDEANLPEKNENHAHASKHVQKQKRNIHDRILEMPPKEIYVGGLDEKREPSKIDRTPSNFFT